MNSIRSTFWARLGLSLAALLLCGSVFAEAQLTLGYIELRDDPRYNKEHMALRLPRHPLGRPFEAAQVAVKEGKFALKVAGGKLELKRVRLDDAEALTAALDAFLADGVSLVLLDLPGALVKKAAIHTRGRDLLLFNLTAFSDELRRNCYAELLHVAPSQAMLNDALAQYLVSRKWRRLLLLTGPSKEDGALHASLQRSIKRYGLKLVGEKPFVLGKDPRERHKNNIALLTGGPDHDLLMVLDSEGEFARDVPYQTLRPRPVAGSAGLVAEWWHWSWERHGAPQLNRRILRKTKRLMRGHDWSAWAAVKIVSEAVLRTESLDPAVLTGYILGPDLVLDGFKGYRLNFRSWSGQLRQPIFLTTGNAVVARAPIDGFLHKENNLDTLGFDRREVSCKMERGG